MQNLRGAGDGGRYSGIVVLTPQVPRRRHPAVTRGTVSVPSQSGGIRVGAWDACGRWLEHLRPSGASLEYTLLFYHCRQSELA